MPRCPHDALTGHSRCRQHHTDHRGTLDAARPTAAQRGYDHTHRRRFRTPVLRRDPHCTCPGCPACLAPGTRCLRPSTDADHWPRTRLQLEAAGQDPNDPRHGRGLCHECHSSHTVRS